MKNEEYYLEHEGKRIHCKLEYPASVQTVEDRCPLLILLHGLTGHMEEPHIVGIGAHAVSLGFAVLRVELYGHGKSDGEFRDHTILKWVDQMMAVIEYAASLPFVTELYLAGHSQGGGTVVLVSAMEHDRLKAILLLSPALLVRDCANEGNMLGYHFDPLHIPTVISASDGLALGGDYFRVAQHLPFAEAIRCFDKPVLIIHADTDESVPVRYAYDAARQYQNAVLRIIPGDNHCYDHHLDQVNAAIEEFFKILRKETTDKNQNSESQGM